MRHAAGRAARLAEELPIALYTIPETAMIGLTEEGCRELGFPYTVGSAQYSQVPRTHITAGDEGLLKLVARRDDRTIVGVHIAGEQASELIQLATFLMAQGATLDTLVDAPYAYPTLSELYRLAAMDALASC
jgi:NAD(P) transhydrogenase